MNPKQDRRHEAFPIMRDKILSGEATHIDDLVVLTGVKKNTMYRWISQELKGKTKEIQNLPALIDDWLKENLSPAQEEIHDYDKIKDKVSITTNEDKSVIYERVMRAVELDGKTDEQLLDICGYDPDLWTLKTHNITLGLAQRGQAVGGGIEPIAWIKLYIEPLKAHDTPVDKIFTSLDNYFINRPKTKLKPIKTRKHDPKGFVLEAPATDWHIGSEAFGRESDQETMLMQIDADIINRAAGRKLKKIILPSMGDIFHYDGKNRTTTRGTPMTYSISPHEAIDIGVRLMVWRVEQYLQLAPVEYIHVPGNHDYILGYMLAKLLEYRFEGHKHITIDSSRLSRKATSIGPNLLGVAHGDIPKTKGRHVNWLSDDFGLQWGPSLYREIHMGHEHHESVDEYSGIYVRKLQAPIYRDEYHYDKAYSDKGKGAETFLWHEDAVKWREHWFTSIDRV